MAMLRTHHADPGHHRRAAELDHQHQRLDGSLPFWQSGFFRRQRSDVVGRVAKDDKLFSVRQRDRLVEFSAPSLMKVLTFPRPGIIQPEARRRCKPKFVVDRLMVIKRRAVSIPWGLRQMRFPAVLHRRRATMSTPRFILCLILLIVVMAPSIYFGWRIWQVGSDPLQPMSTKSREVRVPSGRWLELGRSAFSGDMKVSFQAARSI
jgi:hypothetical protein